MRVSTGVMSLAGGVCLLAAVGSAALTPTPDPTDKPANSTELDISTAPNGWGGAFAAATGFTFSENGGGFNWWFGPTDNVTAVKVVFAEATKVKVAVDYTPVTGDPKWQGDDASAEHYTDGTDNNKVAGTFCPVQQEETMSAAATYCDITLNGNIDSRDHKQIQMITISCADFANHKTVKVEHIYLVKKPALVWDFTPEKSYEKGSEITLPAAAVKAGDDAVEGYTVKYYKVVASGTDEEITLTNGKITAPAEVGQIKIYAKATKASAEEFTSEEKELNIVNPKTRTEIKWTLPNGAELKAGEEFTAAMACAEVWSTKVGDTPGAKLDAAEQAKLVYKAGNTVIAAGDVLPAGKYKVTVEYPENDTYYGCNKDDIADEIVAKWPEVDDPAQLNKKFDFEDGQKGFFLGNGNQQKWDVDASTGANSTSKSLKFIGYATAENNAWDMQPYIEYDHDLNGQKVFVSFYAKTDKEDGYTTKLQMIDPNDGNYGNNTNFDQDVKILDNTWQKYTAVMSPNDKGKAVTGVIRFQLFMGNIGEGSNVWIDEFETRAADIYDAVPLANKGKKSVPLNTLFQDLSDSQSGAEFDQSTGAATITSIDGDYKAWTAKWMDTPFDRDTYESITLVLNDDAQHTSDDFQLSIKHATQNTDDVSPDETKPEDRKYLWSRQKYTVADLTGTPKTITLDFQNDGPQMFSIAAKTAGGKVYIKEAWLNVAKQDQDIDWQAIDDAVDNGITATITPAAGNTPEAVSASLDCDATFSGPKNPTTVKYYVDGSATALSGATATFTSLGEHSVRVVSTPQADEATVTDANKKYDDIYWGEYDETFTFIVKDAARKDQQIVWELTDDKLVGKVGAAIPTTLLSATSKTTDATPAATGLTITYKYYGADGAEITTAPTTFPAAGSFTIEATCGIGSAGTAPNEVKYNAALSKKYEFDISKNATSVEWTATGFGTLAEGIYQLNDGGETVPTAGVVTNTDITPNAAVANAAVTIKVYQSSQAWAKGNEATLTDGKMPAKGEDVQYFLAEISYAGDATYEPSKNSYKITLAKTKEGGALSVVEAAADVVNVEWFAVDGVRNAAPVKGINIKVETLDNGQTRSSKVLVK